MRWRSAIRLLAALAFVVIGFSGGGRAAAHTGFESSTPAEGDVVAEPVDVVTLTFTGEPTAIDGGFEALDSSGVVRLPDSIESLTPGTFELGFAPPLAGGEVGVRWSVQAADGHVLEGAFSFTVDAPAPTTTTIAPADPATEAGESSGVSDSVVADTSLGAATADESDGRADDDAAAAGVAITTPAAPPAESSASDGAIETTTLDDFLDEADDGEIAGERRGFVGRLLSIPSTAVVVGGLAMLAVVYVGSAPGVAAGTRAVRGGAVALAVGALLEYQGSIAASGDDWSSAFTSGTERAIALRFVGAVIVAAGLRSATRTFTRARSLSTAVAADIAPATQRGGAPLRVAWDLRTSSPMLVGVAMIVASFWFDGHTVTRGWAPLHAAVNSVHVVAGSVWFAGVAMLAVVAWTGRRAEHNPAAELVVRFSAIAAVVLGAVIVAGIVMSVLVLDAPSGLWSTPWGRTMLVKSFAVAIAVGLGAYNHVVLRPTLQASPDDPTVARRLRGVLAVEAATLAVVLLVTVWLVVAAT